MKDREITKDIVVIGAGGLGRKVLGLIQSVNKEEPRWRVKGFYDDGAGYGKLIHGLSMLGKMKDLNTQQESLDVAIAIGNSSTRHKVYDGPSKQYLSFSTLISPGATILGEKSAPISKDILCCTRTVLTCDITIGALTLLNLCCTVGHDVAIELFCSLMPSVNISGGAHIRAEIYMGTNSPIINRISIEKDATIGAGAVVTRNTLTDCVVVGCSARPIKSKSQTVYSISQLHL